ncbi:MAG: TIGR02147 family protein [Chitinispirillaceae bacterium]
MKKHESNQNVFFYDNYRNLMRDYFAEQKNRRHSFSYRYFARKAGFASPSFCLHVMEGTKNLSSASIQKVIVGMGLKGKAARYFETLVRYNQSSSPGDKQQLFTHLNRLRKCSTFYKVQKEQCRFYEEWYYPIIRELAVYCDWKDDYAYLGKLLSPPVPADAARSAVDLLCRLDLLRKNEDNRYVQTDTVLSAEDIPPVIVNKLKKEFFFKGLEAEDNYKKPQKYSSSVTFAMSEASYEKVKKMIDDVRKAILVTAVEDRQVDRIFQANFQMFPLSEPLGNEKEKDE